jgi:uncharacterized membrane protein
MLIFTVTLVVLSLVANVLNLFLNNQIEGTGGLAGLGARSVLQTVQQILTFTYSFFSPFWHAGFLVAVIRNARQEQIDHTCLFSGFRRFRRILGHTLSQIAITFLLAIAVTQVASNLFVLTPFAEPILELLTPLVENGAMLDSSGMINLDTLPVDELIHAAIPMLILWALIYLVAYVFLSYCFRMSLYLLLQGAEIGVIASLVQSWKQMRGHKLEILRLDLRYWWYYLLGILITVVCYLDMILPMLGVVFPFDPTIAYFLTLLLYGLLTIALNVWKKWEVDTAYVLAFESIVHPQTTQ